MSEGTTRLHPAAAWAVLITASLGVFLGGVELMVVAIALPSIVASFGGWADLGHASWIVNAYLLAYIVAMPLAGRAADLWGARRLYVVALVLFALGSAGAGMSRLAGPATGLDWLIAARVVQGLGGGALVPLSMALASHLFSGRTRAAALGIEGAATFVGMAIGPSYGAWVLQNVSLPVPGLDLVNWQWIFILNVPAAIITLFLIYVIAGGVETPRAKGGIDVVGALLGSVALVAGVGGVTLSGAHGWTDPLVLGAFGLFVVAGAAFVWFELRRRHPLVNPRLFADRGFSASNAVSLLTGYTLATAIIGGPVFVSRVLFGTDGQAAAALTALTAAIAVGAVAGGAITALAGERTTTVLGALVGIGGLVLALGWGTDTDLPRLARDLAIYGAGFGLTVSPRATAAVEAAGASAYGVASAMLQITRTMGMSVGLAILTSIGQNRIDELTALVNDPARRDALVQQLGHPEFVGVDPRASLALVDVLETWSKGQAALVLNLVIAIALGVAVVTLVPALLLPGRRRERADAGLARRHRVGDDDELAPVPVEALARLHRQPLVVGRLRPGGALAAVAGRVLQRQRLGGRRHRWCAIIRARDVRVDLRHAVDEHAAIGHQDPHLRPDLDVPQVLEEWHRHVPGVGEDVGVRAASGLRRAAQDVGALQPGIVVVRRRPGLEDLHVDAHRPDLELDGGGGGTECRRRRWCRGARTSLRSRSGSRSRRASGSGTGSVAGWMTADVRGRAGLR